MTFNALAWPLVLWAGIRQRARRIPDWAWLVALAAVLRLVNLGVESLWYDEAFTAFMTKLSLHNLWLAILADDHPPLWYGVEWATVRLFGNSTFALRLPAALLGILAVYLMWRLCIHLLHSSRVAFVAGLIVCFLPSALYYSQEARMYSLLLVCALWALDSIIRNDHRQFALAGIGLVYSHNVGVLYVLVLGITWIALLAQTRWKLGNLRQDTFWHVFQRPLTALIRIGITWLPWAIVGFLPQTRSVGGSFWMPPLAAGDVVYPWLSMWMGVRASDALQIPLYLGGLLTIGVGLVMSPRWLLRRFDGRILLSLLIGVPLLDAGISIVWRNIYLHRTLMPCVVLMAIPVAYALVTLRGTGGRMLRLVFIASLLIGVVAHYFPDDDRGRSSTPDWLTPLYAGWQPGDVLYHLSMESAVGLDYYTPGYASAVFPEAGDLAQSLTDQTRQAMGLWPVTLEQLRVLGYRRAWVFFNDTPMTSQVEIDEWRRILQHFPITEIKRNDQQNGLAISYIYLVYLDRPA